ncbi:MAG: WD40 repeat domain-containing protein [Cyanobacteria bacterium J06648_10]
MGTPLQGHAAAVNFLEFSLDGKTIVSTGYDGTVRLWPVWLSEGWVSYTCDRLANYLPERSKTSDAAKEAKRTCDRYAKK